MAESTQYSMEEQEKEKKLNEMIERLKNLTEEHAKSVKDRISIREQLAEATKNHESLLKEQEDLTMKRDVIVECHKGLVGAITKLTNI